MELLKPSDPRTRMRLYNEAIIYEISGLLENGAFKYVNRKKLLKEANILCVIFVLSMEQLGTEAGKYKARSIYCKETQG